MATKLTCDDNIEAYNVTLANTVDALYRLDHKLATYVMHGRLRKLYRIENLEVSRWQRGGNKDVITVTAKWYRLPSGGIVYKGETFVTAECEQLIDWQILYSNGRMVGLVAKSEIGQNFRRGPGIITVPEYDKDTGRVIQPRV